MKLKYKILARFLLICVIPIMAAGMIIYFYVYSETTKSTLAHLESIALLEKKRIEELVDRNNERISSIADNSLLVTTLHTLTQNYNPHDKLVLLEILKEIQSSTTNFDSISILNTDGMIEVSTDSKLSDTELHSLATHTKGKYQSYIDIGSEAEDEENIVIYLVIPIIQNKTVLGSIVAEVKSNALFNVVNDYTGLGNTGESILAKKDSNGDAMVITPLRSDPYTTPYKIISKKEINLPIIHAILGHQTKFDDISDYRGKSVLAVTHYFPTTQWGLVVKIDKEEAFAPIENLRNFIIISDMIIIMISVLASLILSGSISEPIDKLRFACKKISSGNLDTEFKVKGWDEFKDLSFDITAMITALQATERHKNEFISMISHELKTPLVPIMGFCTMLNDPNYLGGLNPEQTEAINQIHRNSKRLKDLINNMLMVQNMEIDAIPFVKEEIHISEFMKNITSLHQSLMHSKNIEFTNSTKVDITIKSDNNKLTEVFTNLIQNAVDFVSHTGGKIEIGVQYNDNDVTFHVKDNGIGISKDRQGDLFKKFYQVDTSIKRQHGGTGLGLVICKGIVEGLGGKIWVESEYGKGATFYFTIPKE